VKDIIWSFLVFLWRRDSESACCLAITLSNHVNMKDCRNLEDYYRGVKEYLDNLESNEDKKSR